MVETRHEQVTSVNLQGATSLRRAATETAYRTKGHYNQYNAPHVTGQKQPKYLEWLPLTIYLSIIKI